ncbi:hypothetical protein Salat_2708800 [Sesamum alatum]|uniref:RVP_2 domain-containing protein n=1 Tax=Sesamum alatum TaxID=300844 RepID=A0AAE2CBE9_9LAMI|nr:hypothetical protein Salat_2708800 [Sesamum alatum]
MQARRAKGLCFNCDETFHSGHRCRPKFLLLLTDDDSTIVGEFWPSPPPPFTESIVQPVTPDVAPSALTKETSHFYLSSDVVSGSLLPRTLRLHATIHGHSVSFLVDSREFTQYLVASCSSLLAPAQAAPPYFFGNGDSILCSGVCAEVPIVMQAHSFIIPFDLLPIHGAEVVLGVQWLRTLGPFISDFAVPSMHFYQGGQLIRHCGESETHPSAATFHQLQRLVASASVAAMHTVTFFSVELPHSQALGTFIDIDSATLQSMHPDLSAILLHFS